MGQSHQDNMLWGECEHNINIQAEPESLATERVNS